MVTQILSILIICLVVYALYRYLAKHEVCVGYNDNNVVPLSIFVIIGIYLYMSINSHSGMIPEIMILGILLKLTHDILKQQYTISFLIKNGPLIKYNLTYFNYILEVLTRWLIVIGLLSFAIGNLL